MLCGKATVEARRRVIHHVGLMQVLQSVESDAPEKEARNGAPLCRGAFPLRVHKCGTGSMGLWRTQARRSQLLNTCLSSWLLRIWWSFEYSQVVLLILDSSKIFRTVIVVAFSQHALLSQSFLWGVHGVALKLCQQKLTTVVVWRYFLEIKEIS